MWLTSGRASDGGVEGLVHNVTVMIQAMSGRSPQLQRKYGPFVQSGAQTQ